MTKSADSVASLGMMRDPLKSGSAPITRLGGSTMIAVSGRRWIEKSLVKRGYYQCDMLKEEIQSEGCLAGSCYRWRLIPNKLPKGIYTRARPASSSPVIW
ncbi:hypothetical protein ES703_22958 [subsurface metagenome]